MTSYLASQLSTPMKPKKFWNPEPSIWLRKMKIWAIKVVSTTMKKNLSAWEKICQMQTRQFSLENKNREANTKNIKTGKATKDRTKFGLVTDLSVDKETKAIALTKNSKRTSCWGEKLKVVTHRMLSWRELIRVETRKQTLLIRNNSNLNIRILRKTNFSTKIPPQIQ